MELLKLLTSCRERCIKWEKQGEQGAEKLLFRLRNFTNDDTKVMSGAIPSTPFRLFECVPQDRPSRRKLNTSWDFDPYVDVLFDYPLVVQSILKGSLSLDDLNWHLAIHVPACPAHCWHCYLPNEMMRRDEGSSTDPTNPDWLSAKDILCAFDKAAKSQSQEKDIHVNVLRVTGGEPFLVPELIAELLKEMPSRDPHSPPYVIWTETNLLPWVKMGAEGNERCFVEEVDQQYKARTTESLLDILKENKDKLIIHPCFHGLNEQDFEAVGMPRLDHGPLTLEQTLKAFHSLHEMEFHLYPTYLLEVSAPQKVSALFDGLKNISRLYPLQTALISIDFYKPAVERLAERSRRRNDDSRPKPKYFSRFAHLIRWRHLLMRDYGIDYARLPRPLAPELADSAFMKKGDNGWANLESRKSGLVNGLWSEVTQAEYEPWLVILKSCVRPEYRRELLTILAAPDGSVVRESYDRRHVEDHLWSRWEVETHNFCEQAQTAALVYAEKSGHGSCIPLRKARIRSITLVGNMVSIDLVLGEFFATPVIQPMGQGKADSWGQAFMRVLTGYFGERVLRGSGNGGRWVLAGERWLFEPLLAKDGERRNSAEMWGRLLNDAILRDETAKDLSKDPNIFLHLEPCKDAEEGETSQNNHGEELILREGDIREYRLHYLISAFEYYQKNGACLDSRIIEITSSTDALVVDGYSPQALAKYGVINFSLRCGKLEGDIPAELVIEAKDQSCFCPRIVLRVSLKKGGASGG